MSTDKQKMCAHVCVPLVGKETFSGIAECSAEGVGQTHPKQREIGWSLYFFP